MKTVIYTFRHFLSSLLCTFLLSMMFCQPSQAAVTFDPSRSVSLAIHYRSGNDQLSDVDFDLYKIANVSSSFQFSLTSPFEEAPVSLDDLKNQKEWQYLASTLETFIRTKNILPTVSLKTNESGEARIASLSSGLYLVKGEQIEYNWNVYTPETALIMLPNADAGGNWLYDVKMYPKPQIEPIERISRQVIKIWNDQSNTSLRPESVAIQLLRNGDLFDTITLNTANGWAYRWEDLDGRFQWSVQEARVPSGYNAKVTQTGDRFIITNSLTGAESPTPDDSLPQTGLMWWPVWVLAGAGVGLFLIGWIKQRRSDS